MRPKAAVFGQGGSGVWCVSLSCVRAFPSEDMFGLQRVDARCTSGCAV
jgi:hypothetical protein